MSFYQEYLKKKKSPGVEESSKEYLREEKVVEEGVNLIKEETDESEVNVIPPVIPIQINSDNGKGKFSEIQKREEIERQKFISRVKGENVPLPDIAKEQLKEEDVRVNVPQKPPGSEKILVRIIIILALMVILGTISLLWYRTIKEGTGPVEVIREVEIKEVFVPEIVAPPSLFNYDFFEYPLITRPNEFSAHLLQYMTRETEEETLTRVIFRDQRDPRNPIFITANYFLDTFSITMPALFEGRINKDSLNVIVHSRDGANEAGFAVIINEMEGFTGMMREWEDHAMRDVSQFLSLLGKETRTEIQTFTPLTYKQVAIRCLNYQDGTSICYSILRGSLGNIFVFATSPNTIKSLIDSL